MSSDTPQADLGVIRHETTFFLSLVSRVLEGDVTGMATALDEHLVDREDEERCAALSFIAPLVTSRSIRKAGSWLFPPPVSVTLLEAALHAAVRAQLNEDGKAAAEVLVRVHGTGGCDAVRMLVGLSACLCAAAEAKTQLRTLKRQVRRSEMLYRVACTVHTAVNIAVPAAFAWYWFSGMPWGAFWGQFIAGALFGFVCYRLYRAWRYFASRP